MIFWFFQKIGFWGILGPPYCGIGATIRIGREMLCLPYAGFLLFHAERVKQGVKAEYNLLVGAKEPLDLVGFFE